MSEAAPIRVLFVCTANICRSAYAERRARALARAAVLRQDVLDHGGTDPVEFASAGVQARDGHHMDRPMAALLSARGGDPHGFRSRHLGAEDILRADLIVTAESSQRTFILDDFPQVVSRLFTLAQLDDALRRVQRDLQGRGLLRALGRARGPVPSERDLTDPYRQGSAAAAACADTIDGYLQVLVPRLVGDDA